MSEWVDRKRLYDEAMVRMHVPGLKLVDEVPSGYRELQDLITVSEKAVKFRYHRWELWLPKRQVVQLRQKRKFWATGWAIERAKDYLIRQGETG